MKMLKIMFVFGIITGLAAVYAKAQCDGPVVVPGYTAGSCLCSNYNNTSGTGSCNPSSGVIGFRNTYTTCGGDGYTSCTTTNQTVGYVNPGCVPTTNMSEQTYYLLLYDDCLATNNGYNNGPCYYEYCYFTTCSMATSGGTPITAAVEVSLGDDCGG